MHSDFKELLSTFNAYHVKYLVVGAYAVSIYAQPRATKDIDILVKTDAENAKAVFAALSQFGALLEGLTFADFAEPGPFFRMGREPVGVDLIAAKLASARPRDLADVDEMRKAEESQDPGSLRR
jgi:hypothetical protein